MAMESNLNRSFSAPDIPNVCRRVFLEECYYQKNSAQFPIRRQISCELFTQFADSKHLPSEFFPDKKLKAFSDKTNDEKCNDIKTSNLMTLGNRFDDSPMDIDLEESASDLNSKNIEDIHPVDSSTPNVMQNYKITVRGRTPMIIKEDNSMMKTKLPRKLKSERIVKQKCDKPAKKKFKIPIIITVLIGIVVIPIYDRYSYNRNINNDVIREDLINNVVNQEEQINQIMRTLEKINSNSNKHILTFIGTTGVGKTYCANFIKRGFKPAQIFEINLESFDSKTLQLHRDVPYLLVIDNLKITDVDRVVKFLDILPVDKSLLILTIFNIQDTEDHSEYKIYMEHFNEIPKLFETSQYLIEAVKFNSFSRLLVKDFYSVLLRDRQVSYEFFLETIDEHNFNYFGFKGFFAKLNLS